MNMGKAEQLRAEIVGLRPVYGDIGNATELLLKNGEVVLDKRVLNSVVKALAGAYAVDIKAQRRLLQEKLSRKGVLPFYLGDGRVFIPLKMRQAITENDAVYGYVDLNFMTDPQPGAGRECWIELSNGIKLQVMSSQSTIVGVQHIGAAVLAIFQPEREKDVVEEMVMKAVRVMINTLAEQVRSLKRIEKKLERKDEE